MTAQPDEEPWAKTRSALSAARRELNPPASDGASQSLRDFEEYLGQDEFDLALKSLAAAGGASKASQEFWRLLACAADGMGLRDRAEQMRRRRPV